ncbi:MAG: Uma2 family endonuclease [Prochloraceae cyanobacterium]|nr:Uma2 family endonuclease [Prochloraceae cyanobacterium]
MITLNIPEGVKIHSHVSDREFEKLAIANSDLRLELTKDGEMIVMPPTGGETGYRNLRIAAQLLDWTDLTQLGLAFDSSTGFRLPNGAVRSPDVAWVSNQNWNSLTSQQKQKFPPLCPEFVIELRSPTDNLETLQKKMLEYLDNGSLLGWLIDPINKKVTIYRPGQDREILDCPTNLSGENILPGFILDLSKIW